MGRTTLLIADSMQAVIKLYAKNKISDSAIYLVLDTFPAEETHGLPLKPVDIKELSTSIRDAFRKFVCNLYSELPRRKVADKSLAENLFSEDPNMWWLTEFSEKSMFRGALIRRIYAIFLINKAIEKYQPFKVFISLQDTELVHEISKAYPQLCNNKDAPFRKPRVKIIMPGVKALLSQLSVVMQIVFVKLLLLGIRPQEQKSKICFFSFFPAWWKSPWSLERTEVFYMNLLGYLSDRGLENDMLTWITGSPITLLKNIVGFRNHAKSEGSRILQQYLSLNMMLKILTMPSGRHLTKINLLSTEFLHDHVGPVDISHMICEDLKMVVASRDFYLNYAIKLALETMQTDYCIFVFRVEFQPFERALLLALPEKTVTIGYQHSTIGKDYLSHVFNLSDVIGNDAQPMPEHVVCSGEIPAKIMIDNGFSEQNVHVCGAIRYPELRKRYSLGLERKSKSNLRRVMVPISLNADEAVGMASMLGSAFIGFESEYQLLLKPHPANDNSELVSNILKEQIPNIGFSVVSANEPFYSALEETDFMLMTGSTIGIEAMALGVPVVLIVNHHIFSFTASSLNAISDCLDIVSSVEALRKILKAVLANAVYFHNKIELQKTAAKKMLGYLDGDKPEELFFRMISKIIKDNSTIGCNKV